MMNAPKPLPSQDDIRNLLDYDAGTGVLLWRRRLETSHYQRTWNSNWAGKEALASISVNGYKHGTLNNIKVYAHRVAWKWFYGKDAGEIDHINGIKTDNRICNLREVDRKANSRNKRLHINNKTGTPGVFWVEQFGYYQVTCCGENFGRFQKLEDAIAARQIAERKYDFHPNNGRRPSDD